MKSSVGVKHHVYKVRGCDQFGEFECFRRYKEFDMFKEWLHARFFGLYLPPMPPKKKIVHLFSVLYKNRELKIKNM